MGSDVQIVEHRGVQVMVALDISRSMLAQDLKPTRLDRAKLEISDLMSRLTGDEVGIVLFSGASFIQFPLTFDYATARTYLRNASPDAITRQGTVIAKAIETAMTGFSEERVSQKIIVIMTDGENHEGDPIAAARQAAEDGAVIYTVGFGSPEGEPVPEYDGQGNVIGYREDDQGRVVITQLDEAALQQVAQAGGGKYFRAVEHGSHRRPRRRDTVVPGREPPERVQPHEHRALPDISARGRALARSHRADDRPALALAVETARDRRRGGWSCLIRRIVYVATALVLFLTACSETPAQVNNAGHEPFEQAEAEVAPEVALDAYEEALDAYELAQESAPEKGEPYYNAANTQYRMEAYDEALRDYDEALKYAEGDLRARGYFNKGNVYFDREEYPDAIEAYKEVLRIQPDNEDAKHNLELALSKLPEQEQGEEPEENDQEGPQEQEQQQDQQEQQDEQNEQDQQQQDNEEQQDEQQDQQDQQQDDQQEDQGEEQEQEQPQPQQRPQTEPITPEQARQLLETFEPQTLQERLQQVLVSPDPQTGLDW